MAPKQMSLVLFALVSVCSAKQLKGETGGGKCKDTQHGTYCPKICSKGLNRTGWACGMPWMTCTVHSIQTKSSNGKPQGAYMQKCMQEYCERGECKQKQGKGSFLLALRRSSQKQGWKKWTQSEYKRGPKGNNWPKSPCADATYFCGELCHNLYHPVMTDLGDHPGTENCNSKKCPNDDKCKKDCIANWDTGMRPIFDDFCACEKETGKGKYPQGLLQQTLPEEEAEAIDVGAFIQTSMSSDQKADEL